MTKSEKEAIDKAWVLHIGEKDRWGDRRKLLELPLKLFPLLARLPEADTDREYIKDLRPLL